MGNFSLDLTKMNSLNIPDSLKNIAWHESNHFWGKTKKKSWQGQDSNS